MLNPSNIIKAINKSIEPFLMEGGSFFSLSPYKQTNRIYRIRATDIVSTAYNNYGNDGEQVNVVKWFKDFWLFVEIQFLNPTGAIISLSLFQGEETDAHKNQLFRAEWDDYGDGVNAHPQPHWHVLTNKAIENTVSSFAEIIPEAKDTFEEVLKDEKNKALDLSSFHFAMHGDWVNNKSHVHLINNEQTLANWFGGLLGYLKTELEFVNSKTSYNHYTI